MREDSMGWRNLAGNRTSADMAPRMHVLVSTLLAGIVVATPVISQMNEGCTVSVLNRTANVQPDANILEKLPFLRIV